MEPPDGEQRPKRPVKQRTPEEEIRFLQSTLTTVPAFVVRLDSDFCIRYINRVQPGLTMEDTLGTSVFPFIEPQYHDVLRQALERARETREPEVFTSKGVGANGASAHYQSTVVPIEEADGTLELAIVTVDVTEHVSRAEALKESEERLRLTLDATGFALWRYDVASGHVEWNDAMHRMTGRDEPMGPQAYLEELVFSEDKPMMQREFEKLSTQGDVEWLEHRIVRPDGEIRQVMVRGLVVRDEDGLPSRVLGGTLDITEQRRLEEHINRVQKLESLGGLTAGIAHNFNNVLMVILPALELVQPEIQGDHAELVQGAITAAQQAAQLVRGLTTLAGQSTAHERKVHDLSSLASRAVSMCAKMFDRRIALVCESAPEQLPVSVNAGAIEQVLINLLINARDALEGSESTQPTIRVFCESQTKTIPAELNHTGRLPLGKLSVQDNGTGMSEQVRKRLFEPFFTTKDVGKGTGLGLATSYAIVRDHGGILRCDSQLGKGATFEMYLPLAGEHELQPNSQRSILIIDDEPMVLKVMVRGLQGDYLVDTASSAKEGLQKAQASQPHLILLDCSMPNQSGFAILPDLRQACPQTRVVFFTGQEVPSAILKTADGHIPKPVELKNLRERVAEYLA